MIFVTVGEQLPFDRLVRAVDEWAQSSGKEVFAQIGKANWKPKHILFKESLDPYEFRDKINSADFVVSHAGMGTIITALEFRKPIVVMPRKAILGEVRNDHQFATALYFSSKGILVASDEIELVGRLNQLVLSNKVITFYNDYHPSKTLIQKIRNFVMDS